MRFGMLGGVLQVMRLFHNMECARFLVFFIFSILRSLLVFFYHVLFLETSYSLQRLNKLRSAMLDGAVVP